MHILHIFKKTLFLIMYKVVVCVRICTSEYNTLGAQKKTGVGPLEIGVTDSCKHLRMGAVT